MLKLNKSLTHVKFVAASDESASKEAAASVNRSENIARLTSLAHNLSCYVVFMFVLFA